MMRVNLMRKHPPLTAMGRLCLCISAAEKLLANGAQRQEFARTVDRMAAEALAEDLETRVSTRAYSYLVGWLVRAKRKATMPDLVPGVIRKRRCRR